MRINHSEYLLYIIPFVIIYLFFKLKTEKVFFNWVRNHWFLSKNKKFKIKNFFYILGTIFLVISLLDFRGPITKIESDIPKQKTIILLDTSSSMLTEDIRPNRFEKAIFVARHFVKKSTGHLISLSLFSDTTKQLVPFTDDVDLLDGRLKALTELNLLEGGSNIKRAIHETVQLLSASSKDGGGNILVISDSEETQDFSDLKITDGVSVVFLGVGTRKGGPIPIRDKNNIFRGYKKHNGQNITSTINEDFIKSLSTVIKNYKYWILNSYSLPTDQIITYFNSIHSRKYEKSSHEVSPVLLSWVLAPSLIMLIISYILSFSKQFIYLPTVIFLLLFSPLYANENPASTIQSPELAPEKKELKMKLENRLKKNSLDNLGKAKLAELMVESGDNESAYKLYNEIKLENDTLKFNKYTMDAANKNYRKAAEGFKELYKSSNDPNLKKKIQNNLLAMLGGKNQEQQQKNDKKNSKNKDEENKDQNKQKSQDQKQQKDQQKEKKNKNKKEENKDNKKDQKKNKEDQQSDEQKDQEQKKREEKKRKELAKKKKIPGVLKNLIENDKKMQRKMLDTTTNENMGNGENKDW